MSAAPLLLACGNPLIPGDALAFEIADRLQEEGFAVRRITDPLQLLSYDLATSVLLDVAYGIDEPVLLQDVDRLRLSRMVSLHDFDVAYFLKLLRELGALHKLRIIAVPPSWRPEDALPAVRELARSGR